MIIGKKIIRYDEIDSTNDEVKRLVKKGLGEGAVIVSDSQTKGRGKPGSAWFSPAGVGVYLSAVVKPFKNPDHLSSITLIGARAVVNAIKKTTGFEAEIKPPNDVLLKDKKISGILVERLASGHLIIGLGVNLNTSVESFPEDLRDHATSLMIESGKSYNLQDFINLLIAELDKEYLAYLAKI